MGIKGACKVLERAVKHLYVLRYPHGTCIPTDSICCQAVQKVV